MRRTLAALTAAALLVVGSLTVSALSQDPARQTLISTDALLTSVTSPQLSELDRLITSFEARVAESPDSLNLRTLGRFRLQRANLTGSIDDYQHGVAAVRASLDLSSNQRESTVLLAGGVLALHRFDEALALSGELLTDNRLDPEALLVAVDANLELGRYPTAEASLDRLAAVLGDHPALLVRRAELAHLEGNQKLAVDFAAQAYELADRLGITGRGLAFYALFQADLVLDLGLQGDAMRLVSEAIHLAPNWAEAHASRADVLAADGDREEAIEALSIALIIQPQDPTWLAARADLHMATGNAAASEADIGLALDLLSRQDQAIYGRTLSRILSDHNRDVATALQLAEVDVASRQDLLGSDTYAWALYRNERFAEAADAIAPVIAAGLQDAEARFHAGLILAAVGDDAGARGHLEWVLRVHPDFHPLLTVEARNALVDLAP